MACVVAACLAGCAGGTEPSGVRLPPNAVAAKATGITVTAADPSFGKQGQVNETVKITGSGFAPGAQAAWLRNGVVDTSITVLSTDYVSSTTLIATINISSQSAVDFRDIRVMAAGGRTQGIGNLLFEVTQAVAIPGTSLARSINDNGEVTGTLSSGDGVFYYNIAAGILETVPPTGTGYDISPAGTAIVGSGGANGALPYLYTRTGAGGTWQGTPLPIGATTTSAVARAMRVDSNGQVVQITGLEYGTGSVTWIWQSATSSWQRILLPGGGEVRHRAISDNGIIGGTASGGRKLGPAVWMPNGTGGYTLTVLSASGAVNGVRFDGGMLVGFTSASVYWLAQPGGTWSAPITVAGGCNGVKDVSDAGRFVLNSCPLGTGKKASVAYADAPYATLTRLGGLGPTDVPATVAGISHGGRYAAGNANTSPTVTVGVYWSLP
jgi:hypothetical protein